MIIIHDAFKEELGTKELPKKEILSHLVICVIFKIFMYFYEGQKKRMDIGAHIFKILIQWSWSQSTFNYEYGDCTVG